MEAQASKMALINASIGDPVTSSNAKQQLRPSFLEHFYISVGIQTESDKKYVDSSTQTEPFEHANDVSEGYRSKSDQISLTDSLSSTPKKSCDSHLDTSVPSNLSNSCVLSESASESEAILKKTIFPIYQKVLSMKVRFMSLVIFS